LFSTELDSDTSQIAIKNEAFNVDNIFPEQVWKSMIDVEEEKRLIKNLSLDYDKFIKHG